MTDEKQADGATGEDGGGAHSDDSETQTGDSGRTPGTAEGDEETVDESLAQKES